MTIKTSILALKLTCIAALAACLSGCIIYTDHDAHHTHGAPANEKPAETGTTNSH